MINVFFSYIQIILSISFIKTYNSTNYTILPLLFKNHDDNLTVEIPKSFDSELNDKILHSSSSLFSNIINLNYTTCFFLKNSDIYAYIYSKPEIINYYCYENKNNLTILKRVLEQYEDKRFISKDNWEKFVYNIMNINKASILSLIKDNTEINDLFAPCHDELHKQIMNIINQMNIPLKFDNVTFNIIIPYNNQMFYLTFKDKTNHYFKTPIYKKIQLKDDSMFIKLVDTDEIDELLQSRILKTILFTTILICILFSLLGVLKYQYKKFDMKITYSWMNINK